MATTSENKDSKQGFVDDATCTTLSSVPLFLGSIKLVAESGLQICNRSVFAKNNHPSDEPTQLQPNLEWDIDDGICNWKPDVPSVAKLYRLHFISPSLTQLNSSYGNWWLLSLFISRMRFCFWLMATELDDLHTAPNRTKSDKSTTLFKIESNRCSGRQDDDDNAYVRGKNINKIES